MKIYRLNGAQFAPDGTEGTQWALLLAENASYWARVQARSRGGQRGLSRGIEFTEAGWNHQNEIRRDARSGGWRAGYSGWGAGVSSSASLQVVVTDFLHPLVLRNGE